MSGAEPKPLPFVYQFAAGESQLRVARQKFDWEADSRVQVPWLVCLK